MTEFKPGDKHHIVKPTIDKPMVWVVPPGVHHITIQRSADGEVLEKRAVKPGQIIMLDELNVRANAKPAATLDVIGKDGLIKP
jgi:hypothetical protein